MKYTTMMATIIRTTIKPVIDDLSPGASAPLPVQSTMLPRLIVAFSLAAGALATAPLPAAPALPAPADAAASTADDSAIPDQRIKAAIADYDHWLDRIAERNDVVGLAKIGRASCRERVEVAVG